MSMQNQQVLEAISNLKGRRNYEEKKSKKLGFNSLYDYIEDKLAKVAKSKHEKKTKTNELFLKKELLEKSNKDSGCSCC